MFKILVVEDDTELNRQVCNYLRLNGYETTGCLGANDAFNAMYGTMFDMIISDIMMPGMDGFEFAKSVRDLNREIPITEYEPRKIKMAITGNGAASKEQVALMLQRTLQH